MRLDWTPAEDGSALQGVQRPKAQAGSGTNSAAIASHMNVMLKRLLLLAALLAPLPAASETASPRPPCGVASYPAAGAAAAPAFAVWSGADLKRTGWRPPACLGWTGDTRFLVALVGEFTSTQTADQLLQRLTAISAYPSIKYWSVTQQQWRPLALETGAPNGLDLAVGRESSYFERGSSNGKTTYRLRVIERTENRIVTSTENVTPISVAIVTAFEPGALQSVSFLDRRGPAAWSFYQMTRAGEASSSFVNGRESSFANRLAAFYRYMAGIPTDLEPPLAAK